MVATRSSDVGGSDYTSGANREDLKQSVALISADQTPFLATIGSVKATNTRHEWAVQSLADPVITASDTAYEFATANNVNQLVTRASNYAQVFGKTIHIDGLQMDNNSIGSAKDWFMNTVMVRRKEIRRDIETKMLANTQFSSAASNNGPYDIGTASAPVMAGLTAYAGTINAVDSGTVKLYAENDAASAGVTITPAITNGTAAWLRSHVGNSDLGRVAVGSHAPRYTADPGTLTALTENHLVSTQQVASDNGGTFSHILVPSRLKKSVTDLLIAGSGGAAQRRAEALSTRVAITVDSVLTDFFDLKIMRNYLMSTTNAGNANNSVYLYNASTVKRAMYQSDKLIEDKQARYGKGAIVVAAETLEVPAPNDVAHIFGIA